MCEHLKILDEELKTMGVKVTYRGQPWSNNCREWVYYDCIFNIKAIRQRIAFDEVVIDEVNDDPKSGREAGFYCTSCHDAVMGLPNDMKGKKVIS